MVDVFQIETVEGEFAREYPNIFEVESNLDKSRQSPRQVDGDVARLRQGRVGHVVEHGGRLGVVEIPAQTEFNSGSFEDLGVPVEPVGAKDDQARKVLGIDEGEQ